MHNSYAHGAVAHHLPFRDVFVKLLFYGFSGIFGNFCLAIMDICFILRNVTLLPSCAIGLCPQIFEQLTI